MNSGCMTQDIWDRTWIAAAGGTRQLDRNGRHWLATTTALGTRLSFMYPGSNRIDPRYSGTGGSRQHRADLLIHDDDDNLEDEAYLHKRAKRGKAGPDRRQMARVCAVINGHLGGKESMR